MSSQTADDTTLDGVIEGLDSENAQLMFMGDDGSSEIVDVDPQGAFTGTIDADTQYAVVLLDDGHFAAPLTSEGRVADENASGDLVLSFTGLEVVVTSGGVSTAGDPLETDDTDTPVGLADGVDLVGLTDAASSVVMSTNELDADLDGVPNLFDPDKDGDNVMDIADTDVPVTDNLPQTGSAAVDSVSGAFVFNNLKLDMSNVMTGIPVDFPHSGQAVETIGWQENPAETPTGFSVLSVEIQDLPGWHLFGFVTTPSDWLIAPSTAVGYAGYPAIGSSWTGQLVQENAGSGLWQVWVRSPQGDATLATSYPNYVATGQSVPLNWDFTGSGIPTSNKIDFYRVKITFSDGVSNVVRYSPASSVFAYRTPPNPVNVTTSTGTVAITMMTPGSTGYSSNPISYPDASTKGDIVLEAIPPRFDVSGSSGIIHGTMAWRADVFYYDSTGSQIGGVLTTPVNFTYTGGANPTVTVAESVLDKTPTRADMNGDGMNDFFTAGTDSSSIAAYKIDITALATSSSDNTGIFIYFTAESAAGTFAGFLP